MTKPTTKIMIFDLHKYFQIFTQCHVGGKKYILRPGPSIKKTNGTPNNMKLVTEQQKIRTFSDTNENVKETIVCCTAVAI